MYFFFQILIEIVEKYQYLKPTKIEQALGILKDKKEKTEMIQDEGKTKIMCHRRITHKLSH